MWHRQLMSHYESHMMSFSACLKLNPNCSFEYCWLLAGVLLPPLWQRLPKEGVTPGKSKITSIYRLLFKVWASEFVFANSSVPFSKTVSHWWEIYNIQQYPYNISGQLSLVQSFQGHPSRIRVQTPLNVPALPPEQRACLSDVTMGWE